MQNGSGSHYLVEIGFVYAASQTVSEDYQF